MKVNETKHSKYLTKTKAIMNEIDSIIKMESLEKVSEIMFEVGDYIVYGNNGVYKVDEIGSMNIQGISKERLYYTLIPVYAKESRVFTPTDNEKVMMRPIISKEEAWALIDDIKNIEVLDFINEKQKENVYKEALRTCDCRELIKIIKTVYLTRQSRIAEGKKLTMSDKKYLDIAEESLFGEFALPLEMEKGELQEFLMNKLKA